MNFNIAIQVSVLDLLDSVWNTFYLAHEINCGFVSLFSKIVTTQEYETGVTPVSHFINKNLASFVIPVVKYF
jgi:hypothetical protein